MKQFQVLYVLILISIANSSEAPNYAKEGCNDTCGGVRIPYPSGIGPSCSVNKWYIIDCNSSTPYLSAFNNMKVVNIGLEEKTITVNVSVISRCQNSDDHIPSIDLGESPFVYFGSQNVLTVEGCGYAAILDNRLPSVFPGISDYRQEVITGCSTTCSNDSTANKSDLRFGLGCCRNTVPYNLKSYTMDLSGLKRLGEDGACGSAFLGDESWLENSVKHFHHPKKKTTNTSFFPVTLNWFLTNKDFNEIPNFWEGKITNSSLYLGNGS
ncbi:putative wall-associated receptor kinase, galacturonan-binding domain-containing protein [Helianthus annuus]|nr:putative wall-associated receptor kinase, galacturonan-binding domain-containing protein [Helianthus annuus]